MVEKNQILGTYIIRKSGNSNSVTVPTNSGFKIGDRVILVLSADGNLEIEKEKIIFGIKLPL